MKYLKSLCIALITLTSISSPNAQEWGDSSFVNRDVTLPRKLSDGEILLIGNSETWDLLNPSAESESWRFFVLSDAPTNTGQDRFEEARKALFLKFYTPTVNNQTRAPTATDRAQKSKTRLTDLVTGYYFPEGRVVRDSQPSLFSNLNDSFKVGLGESVYSKIYISYVDLKRIDASVKSVISEYGLDSHYFENKTTTNLDDGLRSSVTFDQTLTMNGLSTLEVDSNVGQAMHLLNDQKKSPNPDSNTSAENNYADRTFMSFAKNFNGTNITIGLILVLLGFLASKAFKTLNKNK